MNSVTHEKIRWVMVPPIAFALGALTSFGQTYGPASLEPLFNSATSWCVVAFLLAFVVRRPWQAAVLSATSLAMLLAGYYVTANLRGYPVSASSVQIWAVAVVVLAPPLGIAAAWLRTTPSGPRDIRRGLAVAPLGGIAIGEGVYGVLYLAGSTPVAYWWAQMLLGAAFVAIGLAMRARGWRARACGAAATLAMAAVTLAALRAPGWLL